MGHLVSQCGNDRECKQASRGRDIHAHVRYRICPSSPDGTCSARRTRRSRIFHDRLCGDRRWVAADLRSRQHSRRAQHGSARPLSVQVASDAQDIRCIRGDAGAPRAMRPGAGSVTEVLRDRSLVSESSETLDPKNWDDIRAQGHRMLDDMIDYAANIRARPVWQPIPDEARARFRAELPRESSDLGEVYREFADFVLPYTTGNVHPGFMGWVHGGGSAVGMLAEMLAAGLNGNLGGRDHIPIAVERQIVDWTREMFGFPAEASGIFVTGTSMANLMAVLVARTETLGSSVRQRGIEDDGASLVAYTSVAAHGCISQAMDLAGFGSDALRCVEVDSAHRIDVAALRIRIASDRAAGLKPFLVVGSAGPVDIGAIADLAALSALCREEGLWFHVDGAYGALGVLSSALAPRLAGLECADSIAFDFHKWGQVPYDAGFLIVRDGEQHRQTFAAPAAYLRRETRGLAANSIWPCDLGPDLSRGFRALKTWFTLKPYGTAQLGAVITRT